MHARNAARYATLVLAAGIWFLSKFLRYAFPPLFETMQASYGVSNAEVGTIYTGLMVVYASLQFPSGMLSDRFGSVRVVAGGALLASLGSFVLVFDSPAAVLAAAAVLIGAGTGAHKTVTVGILSRVYPARTGRVLGTYDTFGAYGGVGASAVVTLFLVAPPALDGLFSLLPGATWRGVFLLSGVVGVALAAAFARYVPRQLPASSEAASDSEEAPPASAYLRQFANPAFSAFILVTVLFSFSYNGAVAFLPLYLSEVAGLETTTANLLYSALFAVSVVQVLTGDVSDRTGRLPIVVVTVAMAATALLGVIVFANAGAVVLGVAVVTFALGSHGFRPVRGVYLVELLPDRIAAGGFGIVRTLLMGAGAASPTVVGFVADGFGFRIAFALLSASLLGAAAIATGLLLVGGDGRTVTGPS
ncbi:MFS transporter [Halopelagius longus]|nr:MFS transporter [Halopelagius longus]SDQ99041.1 Sugar phosphate permease [Halopelagius longus]